MVIGYGLGAVFDQGTVGLPHLLVLETLVSIVPLVLVAWHCPDGPSSSASNETLHPTTVSKPDGSEHHSEGKSALHLSDGSIRSFLRDAWRAAKMPSLLLLVLAGGLEAGANAAWGGLLPQIFETR